MAWQRLGFVWGPDGSREWARSHAALPFPVELEPGRFRVFFSARAENQMSSIGWVDVEIQGDRHRVTGEGADALLTASTPGHFDDSGLGLGSIVRIPGAADRLYYMGWNLGKLAPWRNSIGLAEGDAGVPRFSRKYIGPLVDRSPEDPFTLSYPWVMRFGEDDWRMWYGSNLAWGASSADMSHAIKEARSTDGLNWRRSADPLFGYKDESEYAQARPSVVREPDGGLTMWFAARGDRYAIASARLAPGSGTWVRADETHGLRPAGEGWDGEMCCYPCVIDSAVGRLMFYNGNDYGRAGFGLAIWTGA